MISKIQNIFEMYLNFSEKNDAANFFKKNIKT